MRRYWNPPAAAPTTFPRFIRQEVDCLLLSGCFSRRQAAGDLSIRGIFPRVPPPLGLQPFVVAGRRRPTLSSLEHVLRGLRGVLATRDVLSLGESARAGLALPPYYCRIVGKRRRFSLSTTTVGRSWLLFFFSVSSGLSLQSSAGVLNFHCRLQIRWQRRSISGQPHRTKRSRNSLATP